MYVRSARFFECINYNIAKRFHQLNNTVLNGMAEVMISLHVSSMKDTARILKDILESKGCIFVSHEKVYRTQ